MPRALGKIVRLDHWILYAWGPEASREVALPPDLKLRRLAPADFEAMQKVEGRFANQARLYFLKRGITSAFGLFAEGRLVHVSWVYTAKEYAREPVEQIRLGAKEAEITNCFTLEDFRGRGLYPLAIRSLSNRLFEQGIERVYMKIEKANIPSQKGILKDGLRPYGTSYHLWSPALSIWNGWYFTSYQ